MSIKSEQLFLYNRLSWSFDLAVALIFTPVTNLLLNWWFVSTTGQFTRNIKGPPNLISRNRCYGLQPCYHVSYPRCNHFSDFLWRFQHKCMFKLPFTKIYLSIRKLLFHVFIIGDWCPMVSRSIVKYQLLQILFNHLREKIQLMSETMVSIISCSVPRTVLHPRTFLTIQMRTAAQYFHVALFIMLYKVVLTI